MKKRSIAFLFSILVPLSALAARKYAEAFPKPRQGAIAGLRKPTARKYAEAFPKSLSVSLACPVSGVTQQELEFPAIPPRKGFTPVLRLDARIVTPTYGGWNRYLSLTLNGKRITKFNNNSQLRLLFRGEGVLAKDKEQIVESGREWWEANELLLFFAPANTTEVDPRFITARDEGFVYYLDISDIASMLLIGADNRIENNAPNKLTLGYSLAANIVQSEARMEAKDINIVYIPNEELEDGRKVVIVEHNPGKPVASIPFDDGTLQVDDTGGIEVITAADRFFIETRFSYQATPAMKFNLLGVNAATGMPGWKPVVTQHSPGEIRLVAKAGDAYTVSRVIRKAAHRFNISDTITSGKRELGVAMHYDISANQQPTHKHRFAGLTDSKGMIYWGGVNPTIFAPGAHGTSVGLVAEDTISRAQMQMSASSNVLTMGTDGTGLRAHDSVTRDWAIYPRADSSYYNFINQVRRDWNVNMPIPGPFYFIESNPKGYVSDFRFVGPWFQYAGGALMSREDFVKQVTPGIRAIRAANPHARIFAKLENNLIPFDVSKYEWKHLLPLTYGDRKDPRSKYGQFASPEVTAKIDAITPYKDSIIRDANGNMMFDNYYIYGKYEAINLMVQPEYNNYRVKSFFEQIDFLIDKVGFDSIYIDQYYPYTIGGFSENRWDGRTVTLAPDGTIAHKRYSYAITGADARARIIRKVRDKGGIVLVNGSPISREVQSTGILSFQEQENSNVNPLLYLDSKPPEVLSGVSAHLAPAPNTLLLRPIRYSRDVKLYPRMVNKGIICALRNGVLFYYYHNGGPNGLKDVNVDCDLGSHLFPFTPVELNEGFLIGRERTVTAISRSFSIAGNAPPEIRHYDREGFYTKHTGCTVTGKPGAWNVDVKLDDWNEVTIIIVKP